MKEVSDLIKDVGAVISAIVVITGFITMLIKPIRKRLISWITHINKTDDTKEELRNLGTLIEKQVALHESLSEDNELQKEAIKCLLRNEIVSIYYKNCDKCELTVHQFENLTSLYEAYVALGGNSFVKKLYDEICNCWVIR